MYNETEGLVNKAVSPINNKTTLIDNQENECQR